MYKKQNNQMLWLGRAGLGKARYGDLASFYDSKVLFLVFCVEYKLRSFLDRTPKTDYEKSMLCLAK